MTFTVEIASVPDREDLVAEIWADTELMAELRYDEGELRVQLYAPPGGRSWDVPFDQLASVLQLARQKLGPPTGKS